MIHTILKVHDFEENMLDKTISISFEEYKITSVKQIKSKLQPFNPQKGEKIFISRGCCLPRVKIKNYYDNQGFNVSNTNELSKADYCIIGQDTFNEYLEHKYFYFIETKKFIDILDQLESFGYSVNIDKELLDSYTLSSIGIHNSFNSDMDNLIPNYEYEDLNWKRVGYIDRANEHFFDELSEKKLIAESEILKNINGDDATVIDKERYETLSNMLNSTDDDNITLAMEIMANSHYSKSIIYLNLLFYNYGRIMDNTGKNKRHVNFKSLLRYMGLSTSNVDSVDCNKVIDNLAIRNRITVDNLNIYCEEFICKLGVRDSATYYGGYLEFVKVNEVILEHEAIKKALGHHFTYRIENNGN